LNLFIVFFFPGRRPPYLWTFSAGYNRAVWRVFKTRSVWGFFFPGRVSLLVGRGFQWLLGGIVSPDEPGTDLRGGWAALSRPRPGSGCFVQGTKRFFSVDPVGSSLVVSNPAPSPLPVLFLTLFHPPLRVSLPHATTSSPRTAVLPPPPEHLPMLFPR